MVDYVGLSAPFKGDFSDAEIDNYINIFKTFDANGNGSIDINEIKAALEQAGEVISPADIAAQVAAVDLNNNNTIEFNEFLLLMKNMKGGGLGKTITRVGSSNLVASEHAQHSFSDEEKQSFADHINSCLLGEAHTESRLPIDTENLDLFAKCKDGVILAKLINFSVPDTIDERVINTKNGMNLFLQTENGNLVVNSAKAIGCNVVNIGASDIIEGREHLVLGLIWQIIRIGLLSQITLQNHPELFRLLEEGEEIGDLLKLPPEQILLRWVNYHLKNAGHPKTVKNFTTDIKDSEAYTILLNQLSKDCDKSALQENDPTNRAEKMLQQADKLGCRKFIRPRDVVNPNSKLNLAFVANLFNTCPGLEALSEEEKSALDDFLFNSEGSREARAFCLWINSLGIDPFVNSLFDDLRDGLIILRVEDKVKPGSVNWKRVNQAVPLNRFKRVENCNYAVDIGKDLKFSLVGIGGTDLVDGNQTLTLALVWQLMRLHVLTILSELAGKIGKSEVTENDMVNWANEQVAASGKSTTMASFKDPSLRNSLFFLDLLNTIRDTVNPDLITPGQTEEDALLNAKYTISIARKLGCTIFLLPEDIVEVKPKMILTLIGSIMSVGLKN